MLCSNIALAFFNLSWQMFVEYLKINNDRLLSYPDRFTVHTICRLVRGDAENRHILIDVTKLL